MFSVIVILIGLAVLAGALGWTPTLVGAKAVFINAWSGAVRLFTQPLTANPVDRVLAVVGIVIILLALVLPVGPVKQAGSHASLEQSIEAFQSEHNLTPDGVWGKNTNNAYLKGN